MTPHAGPATRRHRILAARLLWWPTERLARECRDALERPFVTAEEVRGRLVLRAVNPPAARAGLARGMSLADGRAIVPGVVVRPADPAADAHALERLARWANRFTPRVMPDGVDTIFLDIAGCTRLFGGEEALMASLRGGLEDFGLTARMALADTIGAAWALARHGAEDPAVAPAGAGPSGLMEALADLPVPALRMSAEVAAGLAFFGLDRIHALSVMESSEVVRRFGVEPIRRLDQALGLVAEPLVPLRSSSPREARRAFAEPISTAGAIRAAMDGLVDDLCQTLAGCGEGARRVRLTCHRVDRGRQTLVVGTSRPLRRGSSLVGLFAEKLDRVEPGFGIDEMVMAADVVETIAETQGEWLEDGGRAAAEEELADLLDRLGNRFGFERLSRPVPRESWLPERAARPAPPLREVREGASWPAGRIRPLRLLSTPRPVEAPAGASRLRVALRGRRGPLRVIRGPERLEGEWWLRDALRRDYYVAQDESGRRCWVYREGSEDYDSPPRWFLHGVFG